MKRSNTQDDVYVAAPPASVFRALASLSRDASWWPRSRFTIDGVTISARLPAGGRAVRFDARLAGVRPDEGLVWQFDAGELSGKGEWWLERYRTGTVVHYFLDVGPGSRGRARRFSSRVRRHRKAVRRGMNALKDRMEKAGAPARV